MDLQLFLLVGVMITLHCDVTAKPTHPLKHRKETMEFCRVINNVAENAIKIKVHAENIQKLSNFILTDDCEHYTTESTFVELDSLKMLSLDFDRNSKQHQQEMLTSMWRLIHLLRNMTSYVHDSSWHISHALNTIFKNIREHIHVLDKEASHTLKYLSLGFTSGTQPTGYTVPEVMSMCKEKQEHEPLRAYIVAKDFANAAKFLEKCACLLKCGLEWCIL